VNKILQNEAFNRQLLPNNRKDHRRGGKGGRVDAAESLRDKAATNAPAATDR
jgi:hypothetical protein